VKKWVRIEVLQSVGNPSLMALSVNDTRVTGVKAGPYEIEHTFTIDRDVLLAALGIPKETK
jgi:hypothetical protein